MLSILYALATIASMAEILSLQDQNKRPDIVVTGHPIAETAKVLRACLARHCSPDEDIRATLAHAENEFVAGDYLAARQTMLNSISRNKGYAKTYPVPVSDLLRANARVANHLGEKSSYQIGEYDAVSALKAGLPANDPRVLIQRIEVGDAYASAILIDEAEHQYAAVARDARKSGLPNIEGYALLRSASMYTQLATVRPTMYGGAARDAVRLLQARAKSLPAVFVSASTVLDLRTRAARGDKTAMSSLIAYAQSLPKTTVPQLIYSPAIDLQDLSSAPSNKPNLDGINTEDQWVDLSFWIKPDGSVADVEIWRTSDRLNHNNKWVSLAVKSIKDRRYQPIDRASGDPGILRVERYSLVSDWGEAGDTIGSRIRERVGRPRVAVLDLSQPTKGEVITDQTVH